jgi:hypothetical protein
MNKTLTSFLIAAAAGAALVAPQAAAAHEQTAHLGGVTATLKIGGRPVLTIARAGHIVFRRSQPATAASVRVLHLEAGSEPQVLVQLTGRGHTVEEVLAYDARRHTYTAIQHDFLDSAVTLRDLDHNGRFAFLTTDPAFAGRFTDAAHSGRPVQVYEVFGSMFGLVTGADPKLISADAAHWLRAYKSRASTGWADSVGYIAAWAADENELGAMHSADAYLSQEAKAGHLNGTKLSGRRFAVALDQFLYAAGYVPMCGGG